MVFYGNQWKNEKFYDFFNFFRITARKSLKKQAVNLSKIIVNKKKRPFPSALKNEPYEATKS